MRRVIPVGVLFFALPIINAAVFQDVRSYGARGDGAAKDTAAVQSAIDAAAKAGGGVVLLPPGRYLCGTIHLKSDVTLYLSAGATLAASPDNGDFDPYETLPFKSVSDEETTYFHYALVAAEGAHNIAILGQGTIDGNRTRRHGPKTVALKLCQHVAIRGITVKNSPNYSISLWGCDYVDVDGVTVLNGYADGIDPDACRYVRIANCFVDSADDAICPKASPSMGMDHVRPVEHLTVTNCVLSTNANNFKFGTESSGGFKNIAFSNSTMFPRPTGHHAASGISIESVDGAQIDGVVISNVTMRDVIAPVFIRLGNRARGLDPAVPGSIENVSIQNVIATGATLASSVTGIPGHPVKRVLLDGINVTVEGDSREVRGLDVPEVEAKYPQSTMFGPLPAYALYARHVEGLSLRNIHTRWSKEDRRPSLIFDDVRDLDIDGFRPEKTAGEEPGIWLNDVFNVMLRGAFMGPARRFLRVTGTRSKDVKLFGNDWSSVAEPVIYGPGVQRSVVRALANIGAPVKE